MSPIVTIPMLEAFCCHCIYLFISIDPFSHVTPTSRRVETHRQSVEEIRQLQSPADDSVCSVPEGEGGGRLSSERRLSPAYPVGIQSGPLRTEPLPEQSTQSLATRLDQAAALLNHCKNTHNVHTQPLVCTIRISTSGGVGGPEGGMNKYIVSLKVK